MNEMAPFWEGLERRVFVAQRCQSCQRHRFPARARCIQCGSESAEWVEAPTSGTVYSSTTVYRTVFSEIPPPYAVTAGVMDIGIVFFARSSSELPIGQRVELAFSDVGGKVAPFFVAAEPELPAASGAK